MIKTFCDICGTEVRDLPVAAAMFCQKCEPFRDEFLGEIRRIVAEEEDVKRRRLEKLRATFHQNRVAPVLKAVK